MPVGDRGRGGDRAGRSAGRGSAVSAVSAATVLGAALALAPGFTPAAQAATGGHGATATAPASVSLTYGMPLRISMDGRITWTWRVANKGAGTADDVVVTHEFGQPHRVTRVPRSCTVRGSTAVCKIDRLAPGQTVRGTIEARFRGHNADPMNMSGHVSWEEEGSAIGRSEQPAGSAKTTRPAPAAPAGTPAKPADTAAEPAAPVKLAPAADPAPAATNPEPAATAAKTATSAEGTKPAAQAETAARPPARPAAQPAAQPAAEAKPATRVPELAVTPSSTGGATISLR